MNNLNTSLLFHLPEFIFRNGQESIIKFEVEQAHIYFTRNAGSLTSLEKAPFGGFVLNDRTSHGDLMLLIAKINDWARANKIDRMTIRCFPEVYDETQSAKINQALVESGFELKYVDVTQILRGSEEIDLNIHKKRRIRKCLSLGFTFRQVQVDQLSESYSLIVESRTQKGYPVTMTVKEVENMFALFPKNYLLFGVFENNKMIATSVCIKINSKILYSFYIGDNIAYRSYSPVTLLVNGIHDVCKQQQYELLDLGISTNKGKLNKGLYTFKKSFGSFDSRKLTFEKQL